VWLDRLPVGNDELIRLSSIWRFEVKSLSSVFYVNAYLHESDTSQLTVASGFTSAADARAWILDRISPTNVK
jgi:hypothetical protein